MIGGAVLKPSQARTRTALSEPFHLRSMAMFDETIRSNENG